jgi:hypothetical protein
MSVYFTLYNERRDAPKIATATHVEFAQFMHDQEAITNYHKRC